MLMTIENIFQGGIIDLSHQSLPPNDIQTLAVILSRSHNKQWEKINLSHCSIDDKACIMYSVKFSERRNRCELH